MASFAEPSEIIARYLAGESMAQIGQAFGVSAPAVQQVLARHGVSRRTRHQAFDERVRAMVESGALRRDIAHALGCSLGRVTASFQRQGISSIQNRPRASSQEQIDSLVDRYRSGESVPALADALGVSRPTIRSYLRRREAWRHR